MWKRERVCNRQNQKCGCSWGGSSSDDEKSELVIAGQVGRCSWVLGADEELVCTHPSI